MMVVAAAAAQVVFGGLREEFRSPQGVARENTGPLFWMHGTETEARLRDYVRVAAFTWPGGAFLTGDKSWHIRLKNPRVEVIGRFRTIVSESPLRREGKK